MRESADESGLNHKISDLRECDYFIERIEDSEYET